MSARPAFPTAPAELLDELLKSAKAQGADAADALLVEGTSSSLSCRLGEAEDLERSEGWDLGLRVLIGKRQAVVSSSDLSSHALDELLNRAVAMARCVPEDAYAGLADPDQLATSIPDLDEYDPAEPTAEQMIDMARACEDAARAVKGITNSEGAGVSFGKSTVYLAGTNGFNGTRQGSRFSLSVSVVAGEGTMMERDYDYSSAVWLSDLEDPTVIGTKAGENTVRRLNPQKAKSAQLPIVFDPRVASSLVGHLTGAINGHSVARGTTFLAAKMDKQVFADGITIVDDPLRRRGLRSKPFDGEGIATKQRNLIDDGRLTTWILDLSTSRQLGLETTGHASRGTSGPPSPSATNVHLAPGNITKIDLIAGIKSGFYVTELIGMGVNTITGDYSRGAGGFWIENGEIAYPVNEVTIAGNLADMYMHMTPADDLEFKHATNAPTVRVDGMTIAGR
ncbi:MAG: TldD/PmbA family protein [Rhodospirillales bacterium]|nr:TldD/PmbA family protein [Rhodospirillales bacterium]